MGLPKGIVTACIGFGIALGGLSGYEVLLVIGGIIAAAGVFMLVFGK